MGNTQSIDPSHIRIFENLKKIQNPATKIQMIQTILAGPEYVISAKRAGIYAELLNYVARNSNTQIQNTEVQRTTTLVQSQPKRNHIERLGKNNSDEKAIGYFQACLQMLNLEEEVALTHDSLKSAYKKAVIRAHPDKGGSEKEFEAVTRAYAYLGDILKRINGGRSTEGKVEAPTALSNTRTTDAEAWKIAPVQLNPSKLNLDAFNSMFEKTRIPDPEESGYGDWLKNSEDGRKSSSGPAFSGKFNREVFHKAFEEESRPLRAHGANALVAQELSLARGMGYATELGRTAREDYTVAAVETGKGQAFTDLKKAYTEYNTFTHQTANVKVSSNQSIDQMVKDRKTAPTPLADAELLSLKHAEEALAKQEDVRRRRVAEEAIAENNYFERMKRLVIRNG